PHRNGAPARRPAGAQREGFRARGRGCRIRPAPRPAHRPLRSARGPSPAERQRAHRARPQTRRTRAGRRRRRPPRNGSHVTDEPTPATPPASDDALRQAMHRVRAEVDKAVIGQAGTVTGLLVALLARGHVLLEGVPGVAKTLVVRSFARAVGLDTKRVQFTPDLM